MKNDSNILKIIILVLLICYPVIGQEFYFRGQVSSWITGNFENSFISKVGLRYIPELSIEEPLSADYFLDAELSLNSYLNTDIIDWQIESTTTKIKPYRLWVRFSSNQFDV